jgi:vesicle-fusing ATPase
VIDIEVKFLCHNFEIAKQFSSNEMTWDFIEAFNGIVMSSNQVIIFKFHGHNLKATFKLISIVELADEQWGSAHGGHHQNMGILMENTDVTFMKAPNSQIKIKSSSKNFVTRFTFEASIDNIPKSSPKCNPCF